MNPDALHAKVLPSLLEGTLRHPLPVEWKPEAALSMLSLMGQALRFERPPAPGSFVIEPVFHDDREILADALRRPLVRLLAAKTATDHPARALARAFDRLRLRPHPFDLPSIDIFVRVHAEKLGSTAQHWAARQQSDTGQHGYFDAAQLDENNWTHATLSRRVVYLEKRRADNPDDARALVEATWAQEDADARFRLLQAFETRLSATDQGFLTSLEKDRAPRVRTLAARFLRRIGATSTNPALDACLERIKRGQSGLLRKRSTLQLELPANVKDQTASRWILQAFAEISITELANALQLSEEELIEAAAKDEPLLLALALIATTERRLDLLERVVSNLRNAWERMSETGLDTLGTLTTSERHRWAEILAQPYRKDPPALYPVWDWLHKVMEGEAPPSVMSIVLQSKLLTTIPNQEFALPPWVEVMAAICPALHRKELREQFMELGQSQSSPALALLEVLNGMENANTHG